MRTHTLPLVFALALTGLIFTVPAQAQDQGPLEARDGNPIELVLDGMYATLTSALTKAKAAVFGSTTPGNVNASPVSPMSTLRGMHGPGGSPFWDHLEDAGYKFKELVTEVGIIPGIEFEFVIARELSEADRNSLERALEIDAKRNIGIMPAIQREIIRTLLEASEVQGMRIEELKVTMLPLPGVEFVMAPAEGPMSEEHDAIYRSIKDVKKFLKEKDLETQTPAQ